MSNWNWYMGGDFVESFVWLFMDYSKDILRNNSLIFKPNYFISFLIIFLLTFLIIISLFPLSTNMDIKK